MTLKSLVWADTCTLVLFSKMEKNGKEGRMLKGEDLRWNQKFHFDRILWLLSYISEKVSSKPLNFRIQVSKGGLSYSCRSAVTSVTLWCVPMCVCVLVGGGIKYVETKGFFSLVLTSRRLYLWFPCLCCCCYYLVILAMLSLNFDLRTRLFSLEGNDIAWKHLGRNSSS